MNYAIAIDTSAVALVSLVFFILGLIFGSFLNVWIYRIPLGRSIVSPGSACPKCGAPIRPYDNIPLLGWLMLRGKCRSCKVSISPRYIAVELLMGLLFVTCYLQAGGLLETIKLCIFSFLVLGLIFIDAEHHLLPNRITFPGLGIGLLFSFFVPVHGLEITSFWSFRHHPPHQLIWFTNSLLGAALGALVIYAAGEVYFRFRGVEGTIAEFPVIINNLNARG